MKNLPNLTFAFILISTWPNGEVTREPATTKESCLAALKAELSGLVLPLYSSVPAVSGSCVEAKSDREAGFQDGWDVIKGFNDKKKK